MLFKLQIIFHPLSLIMLNICVTVSFFKSVFRVLSLTWSENNRRKNRITALLCFTLNFLTGSISMLFLLENISTNSTQFQNETKVIIIFTYLGKNRYCVLRNSRKCHMIIKFQPERKKPENKLPLLFKLCFNLFEVYCICFNIYDFIIVLILINDLLRWLFLFNFYCKTPPW